MDGYVGSDSRKKRWMNSDKDDMDKKEVNTEMMTVNRREKHVVPTHVKFDKVRNMMMMIVLSQHHRNRFSPFWVFHAYITLPIYTLQH